MHRSSRFPGCKSIQNAASISPVTLLDFLTPALETNTSRSRHGNISPHQHDPSFESIFYSALSRASSCAISRASHKSSAARAAGRHYPIRYSRCRTTRTRPITSVAQCRTFSTEIVLQEQPIGKAARRLERALGSSAKADNPWSFFDSNTLDFAAQSRLPVAFFHDVDRIQKQLEQAPKKEKGNSEADPVLLKEQLQMLQSVRELEDKLARAKHDLNNAMKKRTASGTPAQQQGKKKSIVLSRDDYKCLVDLYFHSMHSRFDPENPDYSPTPTILEDYAFKLSEDFAPPQAYRDFYEHDEDYRSPLEHIELQMKGQKLREIRLTKVFLDLLLNDDTSNRVLFEAYQKLPKPGVAFLPRGIVRVFLQRMSTPWQKSEKTMIRYLSLMDDMQEAGLPITRSEWASAIYLAGRSFSHVTPKDVMRGFEIWKQMEHQAGVKAHNVTFNILFDLAVRSNMYVVAQKILKEMHDRGLRLNRLGRVSIIYYHGLRRDGDAVRKSYRDFVDAGEIVDTLVLNCVIASLLNAGEPEAAEQIYERMKSLHSQLHIEQGDDGQMKYYKQYPGTGEHSIGREMASNHLDRILLRCSRLKVLLPDHHKELQESMPLVPDHSTFRALIAYHINVSGNLDRVVVLMNDMAEVFGLPFQTILFQLLFKGFAIHGGSGDPDAMWSAQRLSSVWDACRKAIKDRQAYKRARADGSEHILPSIMEVNEIMQEKEQRHHEGEDILPPSVPSLKKLSTWNEFVIDLAVFPRVRRKHIERVHAQLFDDEEMNEETLRKTNNTSSPTEQETYYPLGDPRLDEQEGEYVMPPPSQTIDPEWTQDNDPFEPLELLQDDPERNESTQQDAYGSELEGSPDFDPEARPDARHSPHQVRASQALVCWLLRSYTRCTGSRAHVEEIYNSVRKLWKPLDDHERENVVRVLERCLRDCDKYGPVLRTGTDRDRINRRR